MDGLANDHGVLWSEAAQQAIQQQQHVDLYNVRSGQGWVVQRFASGDSAAEDSLRGGDYVRLFHREVQPTCPRQSTICLQLGQARRWSPAGALAERRHLTILAESSMERI